MSSTTSPPPTATVTTTAADPAPGRTYSTRELQAAAAALAAGQFASTQASMSPVTAPACTPAPAALMHPEEAAAAELVERGVHGAGVVRALGPLVRVRAANTGAGASTITLALADAADRAQLRTRVLDAAAPAWSGLIGASVTELGAQDGWRRGRRGAGVLIDRVAVPINAPEFVPAPRDRTGIGNRIDLTVLDTGWTSRELDACTVDGGCWVVSQPAHVEVVVTRPNALAFGQAEAVLAGLDETPVLVVVVGARRWSGPQFAAAGPRLRRLHEDQGVVFVPLLQVTALPGLGPEPLPKQLMSAAQRLLDRITTIIGPLNTDQP
jgi:hypothetical protein